MPGFWPAIEAPGHRGVFAPARLSAGALRLRRQHRGRPHPGPDPAASGDAVAGEWTPCRVDGHSRGGHFAEAGRPPARPHLPRDLDPGRLEGLRSQHPHAVRCRCGPPRRPGQRTSARGRLPRPLRLPFSHDFRAIPGEPVLHKRVLQGWRRGALAMQLAPHADYQVSGSHVGPIRDRRSSGRWPARWRSPELTTRNGNDRRCDQAPGCAPEAGLARVRVLPRDLGHRPPRHLGSSSAATPACRARPRSGGRSASLGACPWRTSRITREARHRSPTRRPAVGTRSLPL